MSENTVYTLEPSQVHVNMGATYHIGSDYYPYEVVAVRREGKELDVQHCNRVTLSTTKAATPKTITHRSDGFWHEKGKDKNSGHWTIGTRGFYQSPEV